MESNKGFFRGSGVQVQLGLCGCVDVWKMPITICDKSWDCNDDNLQPI